MLFKKPNGTHSFCKILNKVNGIKMVIANKVVNYSANERINVANN